jgi:hypothetical protein
MTAMTGQEYKSSPARLARLFLRSRDNWKRRAADKQATIKKMRITVRDLAASRDHWKSLALQQAEQLRQQPQQPAQAPLGEA